MPALLDNAETDDELGIRERGEFPDSQFVRYRNIPVFAEHSTKTASGRELKFSRAELEAVCAKCNERIEGTGDYAAVIVGHTPDPRALASGQAKPSKAVGFAGPFRMGRVGVGEKAKWAILADFHLYKNEPDLIAKYPRRSPELWLSDRVEDMFLDPIALLGGEAPRLDMGLLYSAVKDGREVEKYAAVSPGPGNVVIPVQVGRDPKNVKKFDSQSQQRSQSQMALSTEDLKQITDAISQMDVFAWAKSKMEAEKGDAGSGEPDADDAKKEYSAGEDDKGDDNDDADDRRMKEDYSRVSRENVKLAGEVAALRKQVEAETAKRIDNERYSKLSDLSESFVFDVDEEFETVRYGKADDAAFTNLCNRIEKRYQPVLADLEAPVPGGTEKYSRAPGQTESKAKYSREQTDRIRAVAVKSINAGKPMTFDEAALLVESGKA